MRFYKDSCYEVRASDLNLTQRGNRPDEIVKAIVCLLTPFTQGNNYAKFFKLFEAVGFHP